jgi:hypothetical protein
MRNVCIVFFIFYANIIASQTPRYNAQLLDTLQHINNTETPSKHFAKMYYQAIEITNTYANTQPENVKRFIFGFESAFGPLFFKAHNAHVQKTVIPITWQQYYKHTNHSELYYQFVGMNAHINGDMWHALVDAYTVDTLLYYKKQLLDFQTAFNTFFDSIYSTTKKYKKLKRLHTLTLGLDKAYGRKMVYRWRKRQVLMAIWYYNNPKKWKRKHKKLLRKKAFWDRYANRWLK